MWLVCWVAPGPAYMVRQTPQIHSIRLASHSKCSAPVVTLQFVAGVYSVHGHALHALGLPVSARSATHSAILECALVMAYALHLEPWASPGIIQLLL